MSLAVRLAEHGLIHCDFNEYNILVNEEVGDWMCMCMCMYVCVCACVCVCVVDKERRERKFK